MKRRRIWKIIGSVLVWALIVAFFVAAALLRHRNEQGRRVGELRVEVCDSNRLQLVTATKIAQSIEQKGLMPTGKAIDSVSLLAINNFVEENCFVRSAQTFVDYKGTLTVRITQRQPLMRVITSKGDDFYLTTNAHLLPTTQGVAINLPLVTGDITLPFPDGFRGDMAAWASANKKNSDKNYIFLLKLINFVRLVENRPELSGNIVQIEVKNDSRKQTEPTIILTPRKGHYSVCLGSLDDIEGKLNRWVRFVEAGVVDLNEQGTLNVAYEGQAVWSKKEHTKVNKKSR